jgi:putative DNA primase/helicase
MADIYNCIDDRHAQEFAQHDPEIISLNVRSIDLSWSSKYRSGEEIENDDVLFILDRLNRNVDRLHSGRINDRTLKQVTKLGGGWHITPFYGLADRAEITYFRFKPDNPTARWSNGKVKTDKYLGAVGESPRAYCPNVPTSVGAAVASRYEMETPGDNFWEWILDHPEIPAILTEGEKKAYSGLATGYAVVSLPGIDSGYKSSSLSDDGSAVRLALIPDLQALAEGGRTIYIAFDRDSTPKTVKRVQRARQNLAKLFAQFGCKTRSIKWDTQYKGLDDFIFGAGREALDQAIENAQNLTPKLQDEGEDKSEKPPSALDMSKNVFRDLFDNRVRFDASVKQYWRYDGNGKWVTCSDEYVFGVVQEYLEEAVSSFSPSYVRNVIEFARKDFLHEGWTEAPNSLFMPFTNGVLEIKTGQLLDHSPDYGFTWQLPRPYSILTTGWGSIDRFLDELTNKNQQLKDIAIAFCNAVLVGRADLQKFLYLFGSGANGKGSFMNLLSMLVGVENTHSTTMAELNESRFESANLMNKRLAIMTDEDKRVGGLSVFKSATGQDPIRYERKGKDATNFIFKGMFVVAANSPTFVGDSNFAIKRRKVDFPCLFRPSERRNLTPEFEADLTAFTTYLLSITDESVKAIIDGADKVAAVKKLNWEMTVRENSIAAFYDEKLIIDPKGNIGCGALYDLYESYCDDSGLKPKNINNFTPSLIELCNDSLGHSIARRHTRDGKVIEGLRLRNDLEVEEENNTLLTHENLSSILKFKTNFPSDLIEKESQPSPHIQGEDFRESQGSHRESQPSQPASDSAKEPKEPESGMKKNENGEVTDF